MMRKEWIVLAVLGLAACGVQHQNVRLEVPSPQVNKPNGKPIVLVSVTDSRSSHADLKLSTAQRSHNVGGVMRGGNGIAIDIADITVADAFLGVVTQSLRGMGYKVVNGEEALGNYPRVSVDITELNVSMPMNLLRAMTYSQKMIADVSTHVMVNNGKTSQSFDVSGHGENVYQRVIPENWEIALNRAIADYVKNFQGKMIDADQE